MALPPLHAPVPLAASHGLAGFDSGTPVLDAWLRERALANQQVGASRTFVVADDAGLVFGFYSLAAGAVAHAIASGAIRRNMPDPVPVLVLGRLAVARAAQGHGLGPALLKDALSRSLAVARDVGVRALLVHALDERAAGFYRHYGFRHSPLHPLTLMLRMPSDKLTR